MRALGTIAFKAGVAINLINSFQNQILDGIKILAIERSSYPFLKYLRFNAGYIYTIYKYMG